MHEQSETTQGPGNQWFNVYGQGTAVPGRPLPGGGPYDALVEAVKAALRRSKATPIADEQPLAVQRAWERVAGQKPIQQDPMSQFLLMRQQVP